MLVRFQPASIVTTKKASIKDDVLLKARDAYADHVTELESEIKPIKLDIQPRPDFIGAAKNKRTLASLRDAVDTELANAKISADAVAKDIRAKLTCAKRMPRDMGFCLRTCSSSSAKLRKTFSL